MKKFFIAFLAFYLGIIVFMPKKELFYTAQKYLSSQNIYINAKVESNIISLILKDAKVYINGINLINFQKSDIYMFILYNRIEIKKITINFNNLKINKLTLTYDITNPIKIKINGKSNFGNINGIVDLKNKAIKIYILNAKDFIKRYLRKDKKGYFYYEKY